MTLEQAYEKIDGMPWKVNGVSGTLKVERISGMTEVVHHANAAGKRSKHYREIRQQLGDDFTTTVSQDIDEMGRIFDAVGM